MPGIVYCGGQGGDQGTRALAYNLYNAKFTNDEHTEYTIGSEAGIKGLTLLGGEPFEPQNQGAVVELLRQVMRLLPDVQWRTAEDFDFACCYPSPELNRRGIQWDLHYFKYCFLKATGLEFEEERLEDDFDRMADVLLQSREETFMYRDFQSRNIMIHGGKPWLIDFQGGRRGPVEYDLVSFLWQARARFTPEMRHQLVEEYLRSARRYRSFDEKAFGRRLQYFVLFRTLQVLGAYGYRGYFEHKAHFVQSIPMAIDNLRALLAENDFADMPYLVDLLRRMIALPLFELSEEADELTVRITSFSYKKGIPEDASGNGGGFVFDCRAIHNPGRYDEYKQLTGMDEPVINFLDKEEAMQKFLEHVYGIVDYSVEKYRSRGFKNLMVNFGCTGGQHRSVYSAEHLAVHPLQYDFLGKSIFSKKLISNIVGQLIFQAVAHKAASQHSTAPLVAKNIP